MKKVKKQWVVVSVASLSMIGAVAYGTESVRARADSTPQTTASQGSTTSTDSGTSGDSITSDQQNNNQQSISNGDDGLSDRMGNASSSATAFNNIDQSQTYSSAINQGASDAFNKKGNNAANLSGQAQNYYQASYDGATSAINAYNNSTQGQGTGTQDYTFYGNTPAKVTGYTGDKSNGASGSTGGVGGSSVVSNGGGSVPTTGSTGSDLLGTPQGYGTLSSSGQGGADDPQSASTSSQNYQNTKVNKLNSVNNHSVQFTNGTQINVPTANTPAILNDRKKYDPYAGLQSAFNQGVSYALSQQGMADAESGKWRGVGTDGSGTTSDFYASAQGDLHQSKNPYDLAYVGATDAISKQFDYLNNYQGSVAQLSSSILGSIYLNAYNDVANQTQNGTAFIANSNQFYAVGMGSTNFTNKGTLPAGITTIKFVNDVNLDGINGVEAPGTYNGNGSLTIDGQNHMVDMHGLSYSINNVNQLKVQNFQTIYGSDYYGPFINAQSNASIRYRNINYVGSQLLSAYDNDAYFSGNVNVIIPQSSDYYFSPFNNGTGIFIEGGGNQENLEVNNFILEPYSNYFGSSGNSGSTNIVSTGNVTIGQGSNMTLVSADGGTNSVDGANFGIYFKGSNAKLNVNKDATLNIIPSNLSSTKSYYGSGIYTAGKTAINVNGGTINVEVNGVPGQYAEALDFKGNTSLNILNGGLVQVKLSNLKSSSAYYGTLTQVGGGNLNVGNRGNLVIQTTDNSGSTGNLPIYGQDLIVNNVGNSRIVLTKNDKTGRFSNNDITAYTVAVNGTPYYYFTLPNGSKNYTATDSSGNKVSGTITGNTLEIDPIPSITFAGPISRTQNSDGTSTINAYARVTKYSPSVGPVYVGVYSGNGTSISNMQLLNNQSTNATTANLNQTVDPNSYTTTQSINSNYQDGQIIPISFNLWIKYCQYG